MFSLVTTTSELITMKSMKEKNTGSIISTTSPNNETEIALSQKLQREEVLSLSFHSDIHIILSTFSDLIEELVGFYLSLS